MFVLKDEKGYLGKDDFDRPTIVNNSKTAITFKSRYAAKNFLKNLPAIYQNKNWLVCPSESAYYTEELGVEEMEGSLFGDEKPLFLSSSPTPIEENDIDLREFFTNAINVMPNIDKFISNMYQNENTANMKILDIRHYIRNNDHKLGAIQMQRLGYYLQSLERERYKYKSNRLIASLFADNISALKDKNNLIKINSILMSSYNPRVLSDEDIEEIINKKKCESNIA